MNEDNRVDISGFFVELKKKWLFILIAALLFGIVFSLAAYVRQDWKLKSAGKHVNAVLSEDEQKQIERIRELQADLAGMEQYNKESLWMNIDPYQESIVNLQYYVNGSNGNEADFIYACKRYVELSGIVSDIAEQFSAGYEERYIGELLAFNSNTDESGDIITNSFSVVVLGRDETEAKELAALVNAAIMRYAEKQKVNFGEISCTLLDEVYSEKVDSILKSVQNQTKEIIINYQLKIAELTSVLTPLQLEELIKEEKQDDSANAGNAEEKPAVKAGFSLKYLVAGWILGAIVSVCVVLCIYLFKTVVSTEAELMRIFGLRVIGRFREKVPSQPETERAVKELTAGIYALCLAKKIKDIYLLNMLKREMNAGFVQEASEMLKEKGINVVIGRQISEYPDEITELVKYSNVVLLVRLRETKFDTICESLASCSEFGMEVSGCIALK